MMELFLYSAIDFLSVVPSSSVTCSVRVFKKFKILRNLSQGFKLGWNMYLVNIFILQDAGIRDLLVKLDFHSDLKSYNV